MATIKTREEWMQAFIKEARPVFRKAGKAIPRKVRAACGFSSKGARSNRIGECWTDSVSKDGTFEIFIVPGIADASRVADILTHELIHAAVGIEAGHKKPFVDMMKKLGLEGKPTATVAGAGWHEWADPIVKKLGKYPHAALDGGQGGAKKQTTRMLKCECNQCGFIFRTTAKWIEDTPFLQCPNADCGGDINVG